MAKLNKLQAQAIINKLARSAETLRTELINKEKENYTPSKNSERLLDIINKKNEAHDAVTRYSNELTDFTNSIGLKGVYAYTKPEEALKLLKEHEISSKFPAVDLDAALDDLIIASVDADFNIDEFINQYLKQMKK